MSGTLCQEGKSLQGWFTLCDTCNYCSPGFTGARGHTDCVKPFCHPVGAPENIWKSHRLWSNPGPNKDSVAIYECVRLSNWGLIKASLTRPPPQAFHHITLYHKDRRGQVKVIKNTRQRFASTSWWKKKKASAKCLFFLKKKRYDVWY